MDFRSIHDMLILLHAASAAISFFAGGFLIFSPTHISNRWLFGFYWWALVAMIVFLSGAMLAYWTEYSGIERILYSGLLALSVYMLYRAYSASILLETRRNHWEEAFVEHIGFTLISLFEGFVIVAVLNAGGPGWLVALIAILGVLLGRWVIGLSQRRAV